MEVSDKEKLMLNTLVRARQRHGPTRAALDNYENQAIESMCVHTRDNEAQERMYRPPWV